ncbi:MAG: DUF4115 domain-containing protein [Nocardioidaceae bacterium]|nr:DUF4115 domain-containing protein [Nocardioidaceae bacterium]
MSTDATYDDTDFDTDLGTDLDTDTGEEDQGDLVAIRRNLLLSGVVGGLSVLIGAAFLARGSWALDGLLGVLLLALGAVHLAALASWRVPVLVADEQGIRLRLGMSWRGLPWAAVRQVVVEHPESPLREGRLVVVPRDLTAVSDGVDALAGLHLRWNRLWYGSPLSVPLGMTTYTDTPDLAADLRALSDGRVDVADLRGKQLANLDEVPARAPEHAAQAGEDPASEEPPVEEPPVEEPPVEEPDALFDQDRDELPPPPEDDLLPEPVSPLREIRRPSRVEVRLDRPAVQPATHDEHGDADEDTGPVMAIPAQRRPGEIAELLAGGEVHEPEPVVEEAPKPVIGTKIAHAREMLDMSIDELSQRTRIRPHVLEAMERDDFVPCGGDVYARGHLTSVARVLGLSLDPLLATYEERYAQGPINARRVFEADLSTSMSGGMRASIGGPRWSLLISAVLCLAMVWGLARIFAGDGEHLSAAPNPDSQIAGLSGNHQPITSPLTRTSTITVSAAHAPTHVVVRDRSGRILWSGNLRIGHKRTVAGVAPFTVEADNAGAVEVLRKGKSLGTVGMAGEAGSKKF